MKYIIYSFLIFNFLIISISDIAAQESMIKLDGKYVLLIKKKKSSDNFSDTLVYDTNNQTFSKINGDKSIFESNRSVKYFGAFASANQLKEDGLVVLLRSSSNQLEKLRILSRDGQLSEGQRQNIKMKITAIENENNIINKALITAFSNNYNFSSVHFMYDSSLTSLRNGVRQGIFVDKNGLIDKSIEFNSTNYYICRYTLVSTSKESEGLVMENADKQRVKPPFPSVSVSGSSGLNMLLQLLTDNDTFYEKKIQKDVVKLQDNLLKIMINSEKMFKKP